MDYKSNKHNLCVCSYVACELNKHEQCRTCDHAQEFLEHNCLHLKRLASLHVWLSLKKFSPLVSLSVQTFCYSVCKILWNILLWHHARIAFTGNKYPYINFKISTMKFDEVIFLACVTYSIRALGDCPNLCDLPNPSLFDYLSELVRLRSAH